MDRDRVLAQRKHKGTRKLSAEYTKCSEAVLRQRTRNPPTHSKELTIMMLVASMSCASLGLSGKRIGIEFPVVSTTRWHTLQAFEVTRGPGTSQEYLTASYSNSVRWCLGNVQNTTCMEAMFVLHAVTDLTIVLASTPSTSLL